MGVCASKGEVNRIQQDVVTDLAEIKIGKQDFIQ
jgi:calcium-dependent protein kinase